MSRWWRAHDKALENAKLQRLPAPLFRSWFNLMCIASSNGGALPPIGEVAFGLRLSEHKAAEAITALVAAKLFDLQAGGTFKPHNWEKHQFKSDVTDHTNADRQKRYRDRHRNGENAVTVTVTDTVTQGVTAKRPETETETEKKDSRAVATATRTEPERFDEFWSSYPRRAGANPRWPAAQRFEKLVKSGVEPDLIIAGARRYADEIRGLGKERTEFVAQAIVWLNQRRWCDYGEPETAPAVAGKFYARPETPQLTAWDNFLKSARGKGLPRDRGGGWWVESEWPPGYLPSAPAERVA